VIDAIASYSWDVAEVQLLLRRLSAAMADEVDLLASRPPPASGRDVEPAGAW
jgi:hypothetical protein